MALFPSDSKRGENPDIREKMKLIPSRRIVGDGGGAPVSSKYSSMVLRRQRWSEKMK
ncbi:hypothetical protein Dimus_000473, partial [Dionaea muscipula]